jgi:drug/metabolite transporter (DMT)-like permease
VHTGEGSEDSVTSVQGAQDVSARRLAFAAAVGACLGWSSLYTAAKVAMREVTGLMVAFDRTTVACVVLTLIVIARAGGIRPGVAHLLATARSARWGAVELGLVNFAGTSVLAMTAQQYLPASVNGLVNNLAPLWLSIWAATTDGAVRPLLLVAGSAVAAVGVGAVLLGDAVFGTGAAVLPDPTPSTWMGVAISLSGSLLIGYQNFVARRVMPGHDAIAITALGTATGSLATGAVLALGVGGNLATFATVDAKTLLALAWLGTVTTAFNFTLWGYALSVLPVAQIANLQYMVPPLSVVVGVAALGEPIGPGLVAGAVAIFVGIILAQRGAARG